MRELPFFDAKVDCREFTEALTRFQRETKLGWAEVIQMQTRLLVERLIEWTPPFGKDKAAQRRGAARVEQDIRRVFVPAKDVPFLVKEIAQRRLQEFSQRNDFHGFHFRNSKIQKAWDNENWAALEIIFTRSQKRKMRELEISQVPDPSRHQAARIAGRVPKHQRRRSIIRRASALSAYIKKVQKRVGAAKSGWIPAAKFLKGKFPQWVIQATLLGSIRDRSSNLINPSIVISNEVAYVSDIFSSSKQDELIRSRIRDMERSTRHLVEAKRRKAGL